MKKKIDKIRNSLLYLLISTILKFCFSILIILFVFIVVVQKVSDNKATLGGYSIFTVVSGSMEPVYHVWDMLIAKKVDPSTIKVGDDIVYLGSESDFKDRIVTHRIINVRKTTKNLYFTTKGVANDVADPEINSSQVYGKVVYRSVILCFLSKVLNNIYGFFICIFIPFSLLLFFEILNFINSRKNCKEEIVEKNDTEYENKTIENKEEKKEIENKKEEKEDLEIL